MIIHASLTSKITIKLQPLNNTYIDIALNPGGSIDVWTQPLYPINREVVSGIKKRYNQEFKQTIVELYRSGTSVRDFSSKYGESEVTIYKWIKTISFIEISEYLNFMEGYEEKFKLDEKEFVATIFDPTGDAGMILILGDNVDGKKEGLTFLHLCLSRGGEVEHGLDSLAFYSPGDARAFVENLSNMNALEFMFKSLGFRPGYF